MIRSMGRRVRPSRLAARGGLLENRRLGFMELLHMSETKKSKGCPGRCPTLPVECLVNKNHLMNHLLTEIAYVLDRSGSMQSMQEPAIAGFNLFLTTQLDVPGDAHLTLVLFDDEYLVPFSAIPIQNAPKLDARTYIPRGSTALLDAIGLTIKDMDERLAKVADVDKPGKVIIAIFTDGFENASREYTAAHISDLIRHHRNEKGWEFLFLAANQDAIATAAAMSMEVNSSGNLKFCADGVRTSGSAMSRKVRAMRMKTSGMMDSQAREDDAKPMEDIVREEEQKGDSDNSPA